MCVEDAMWGTMINRLGDVAKIAVLFFVLSVGGALAAEPEIKDCPEGAGADLAPVSFSDLIQGPPPPPPTG